MVEQVTFSEEDVQVYAVFGYDLNGNGIADIMEVPHQLIFDANGGDASSVPSSVSGMTGEAVCIPNTVPPHEGG